VASKKKYTKQQAQGAKRGRPAGKKKDAAKAEEPKQEAPQGQQGALIPDAGLVAHLFTGKRDIKVKMTEADFLRVLRDQQGVSKDIHETRDKRERQEERISEAEDALRARRAELRELEIIEEDLNQRLIDMIDANKDGFRIEREEVDEYFLNGEIVTYKKGTKIEVAPRRNATATEWEDARELKAGEKPVKRWAKGAPVPGKPGLVLLDGGKEARADASGEYGYIGPEDDPAWPNRKRRDDSKKGKKEKEPRTLPHSVTQGTAGASSADDVPPAELADRGNPNSAQAVAPKQDAPASADDDLR